ncbi:glycosyltransferase [Bordetella pertussis]|nr:glycosyltransferase [Bordetella pertussis]
MLIDAYARIAPRYPDWDLVILGEGEECAALQRRVDEAGLAQRVALPGRAGNVGDWYACAALYVLTSRFEGLSNTLLESMASGLMPVSFDCDTGPREIVRPGVDGVLVRPAGDAGAMAQALAAAIDDEPGRRAMAARAIDVRERFSARHVLDLWQQLFDDALSQAK